MNEITSALHDLATVIAQNSSSNDGFYISFPASVYDRLAFEIEQQNRLVGLAREIQPLMKMTTPAGTIFIARGNK